jgi:hypothetical protein
LRRNDCHPVFEVIKTRQERFASVERNIDAAERMSSSVLIYSSSELGGGFQRHEVGLTTPALVDVVIDVTVVAVQVASRRYLTDELAHRRPVGNRRISLPRIA